MNYAINCIGINHGDASLPPHRWLHCDIVLLVNSCRQN